ncbi:hypothetical protein BsWGS_19764 [Bradybaena similaris]
MHVCQLSKKTCLLPSGMIILPVNPVKNLPSGVTILPANPVKNLPSGVTILPVNPVENLASGVTSMFASRHSKKTCLVVSQACLPVDTVKNLLSGVTILPVDPVKNLASAVTTCLPANPVLQGCKPFWGWKFSLICAPGSTQSKMTMTFCEKPEQLA